MTLIAILDDRATNRQIFSKLAASLEPGIQVQAFGDPLSALDWLDANPPDLVIADYKMPLINGAEFTRRLRQRPYGADVPLIIVTAYDDREDKLAALQAGATDFLQTPVDHQEFVSRARNLLLLRHHQQRAKARAVWLEQALATSQALRADLDRDLDHRPQPMNQVGPAQMLDALPALVCATDWSGAYCFVNAPFAAQAGSGGLTGQAAYAHWEPGRAGRHREQDRLVLATGAPLPRYEETVTDEAGTCQVWLTAKTPLCDAAGEAVGVLTTCVALSDHPRAAPDPPRPLRHDRLTGLANQEQLRETMQSRIGTASGGFALHLIGLDAFRPINEAHGDEIGDALLQAVAARLRQVARPEDLLARGRGDAFVVLQSRDPDEVAAVSLADRLRRALAEPFQFGDLGLAVTASIGIARFPDDGLTPTELLRGARRAMLAAKSSGGNAARLARADPPQGRFRLDAEPLTPPAAEPLMPPAAEPLLPPAGGKPGHPIGPP